MIKMLRSSSLHWLKRIKTLRNSRRSLLKMEEMNLRFPCESLWRLISHMKPSIVAAEKKENGKENKSTDRKRELLPFLALPNDPQVRNMLKAPKEQGTKSKRETEKDKGKKKKKEEKVKENQKEKLPMDDLMAFLESHAPSKVNERDRSRSKSEEKVNVKEEVSRKKERQRSRSPEYRKRSTRHRSRSGDRRSRSRDRRSRSRDKRSKSRGRSRSRD
ncbi:UNVERIFIED_CONTAM: hypothetical protein GTU68_023810, partial [Idotea baltica]|nr:hypothetical protein [Idotea baltica]